MIGQAIWVKNVNRNAKKQKRPPKSSKNQMFISGLCSTSDDRPNDLKKKCQPKCKKTKGPLSHWKIKCSFLDYIQLLMIGWAIWVKNVNQNAKKQKNEKGPLSHRKIKCSFLDYVQLLMIGQAIWAKNIDRNTKKWKRPPKSLKNKMLFLDYVQLLMIGQAIWSKNMLTEMQNNKKGPLSHQKIKCSFLDYIQLLMIGQAIRVKNVNRNAKKQKRPPKSSKNKMFISGLCSTSDDWPSNLSKKHQPKHKKNEKGPLSHQKIKCSFLDYIQLLMIGQAIRVKNVNRNAKKQKRPPKSSKNQMFISGLCSTSDDWPNDLKKKHQPKCKKTKKAP